MVTGIDSTCPLSPGRVVFVHDRLIASSTPNPLLLFYQSTWVSIIAIATDRFMFGKNFSNSSTY